MPVAGNRPNHALSEVTNGFGVTSTPSERGCAPLLSVSGSLERSCGSTWDEIVGSASSLRDTLVRIERVAPTTTTVLITGETGTGKELVARTIHRRSSRALHPLICVNLAAMPHELVAAELFGHEAGAFTGATQRRIGRFEAAHGGTLFLDEVGELSPAVQVMVLRALQEGEYERVGSSQTRRADVRVIGATNRDLHEAVDQKVFRRDLFYRLAVFPIRVPALRERREDIPALAEYILASVARRIGRQFKGIEQESLDRLMAHAWPGNVRELQNVIERSAIMSDGDHLHVPPLFRSPLDMVDLPGGYGLTETVKDDETHAIEQALRQANGRVSGPHGAAAILKIPSSTLESKIRRLEINKFRYRTVA
jgi:transcriptional regulator with GAF, ATPase, and Fis domain